LSKIALSPNASGTGTFTVAAPNTNTDYTLTLPQGTGTVVANNVNSAIVSGASVSASGASVDFTSIPSWVNRITIMLSGISSSSTSNYQIQLGDSGGIETTGYSCRVVYFQSSSIGGANATSGFVIANYAAANTTSGALTLTLLTGNTWVATGYFADSGTNASSTGGSKALSATLDRVRVTSTGADTFDAGSINILYE